MTTFIIKYSISLFTTCGGQGDRGPRYASRIPPSSRTFIKDVCNGSNAGSGYLLTNFRVRCWPHLQMHMVRLFQPLLMRLIPPLMHANSWSIFYHPTWTVPPSIVPAMSPPWADTRPSPKSTGCGVIRDKFIFSSYHSLSWSNWMRCPWQLWVCVPCPFYCRSH